MFSEKARTYRYFDRDLCMMFEKPEPWAPPDGKGEGDALLRTSRAYIAYGEPLLRAGITRCFKEKLGSFHGKYYQAYRCSNGYGENDVSRDQVLYALIALKFNGDSVYFREIGRKLRFRLSKRFIQGPGMWLWIREKWFIYGIVEFISIIFAVLWNKLLYRIQKRRTAYSEAWYYHVNMSTGSWQKSNWGNGPWYFDESPEARKLPSGKKLYNEYCMKMETKKWYRRFDKTEYPTYASVMTALMVYFMPRKSIMRKLLAKTLLWNANGENNLLLRALFLDNVTAAEVDALKPMRGYRWTSRFDGSCFHEYLEGDDAKYNVLDKDMLYAIIKRNTRINGKFD